MAHRCEAVEELVRPDERARFAGDGYVAVDRPVFRPAELDEVAAAMAELLARRDELAPALLHDLGPGPTDARVLEIVWPSRLRPQLKRSAVFLRAREIAAELLGRPVSFHFDHLIDKPAHSTGETPWHQDLAFESDPGEKVTIWVPLVDVDAANGCMRFLPLRDRSLVAHERVGRSGLRAVGIDTTNAVAAALSRGGFSAHRECTLHGTGPNLSDTSRPAWILRFRRDERRALRRAASEVAKGTSSAPVLHRIARVAAAEQLYTSE